MGQAWGKQENAQASADQVDRQVKAPSAAGEKRRRDQEQKVEGTVARKSRKANTNGSVHAQQGKKKRQNAGKKEKSASNGQGEKLKKKLKLKYLDQAGDSANKWPKRLIVLDINGFLLYRSKNVVEGLQRNGFDLLGNNLYDRPYARQFLKWLRTRGYVIGLWTSATRPVADSLRKHLIPDTGHFSMQPVFCFSQRECVSLGRSASRNTLLFSKPLSVVWESDVAKAHGFNADNTIIIDDSQEKLQSNLANAIITKSFNASSPDARTLALEELGPGGTLWTYLDALARHPGSVQAFLREHPFSAP